MFNSIQSDPDMSNNDVDDDVVDDQRNNNRMYKYI